MPSLEHICKATNDHPLALYLKRQEQKIVGQCVLCQTQFSFSTDQYEEMHNWYVTHRNPTRGNTLYFVYKKKIT